MSVLSFPWASRHVPGAHAAPTAARHRVTELAMPAHPPWPKEILDRVGASLLILLLLPAMLVIALVVLVDGGGPVIFRQQRVGKNGQHFTILKFRTMCADAETKLFEVLDAAGVEHGPLYKLRRDPRVTRGGALLRRLSLDELPQLFNVLGGSMSLVGPRPQMDFEVERYTPWQARRLLVKPGMTGLWQTSGRNDLPWDEAVALDVEYVDHWSFGLDLKLLWRTIDAVWSARGAC
jgi:lipopolysaccharide/colanic/teichoic acid biosynthesis glycosyltransferase